MHDPVCMIGGEAEALYVSKPLGQARADALACVRYFEFYAGAADKVHGQTIPYRAGYTVLTLREPHGVTGHIIPWNYPMQIAGRSVGAALAMGNACVVKPGEDASQTALMLGRLAGEAGLPPGMLNTAPFSEASERLRFKQIMSDNELFELSKAVGVASASMRDGDHVIGTGIAPHMGGALGGAWAISISDGRPFAVIWQSDAPPRFFGGTLSDLPEQLRDFASKRY
jgi:hypothetical protein